VVDHQHDDRADEQQYQLEIKEDGRPGSGEADAARDKNADNAGDDDAEQLPGNVDVEEDLQGPRGPATAMTTTEAAAMQ